MKAVELKPMDLMRERSTPEARMARNLEQLEKISEEFEALVVGMMVKSMRETVPEDTLMGDGNAVGTYQSLLDEEYSKQLGAKGDLDISELVYRQYMDQIIAESGKESGR